MMQGSRPNWFAQPSWWFAAIVIAALIGASIPAYVDAMGDSIGKLMGMPLLIALVIMVAYSRTALLLIIVLLRGSTEVLFAESRFSIAGAQIGLGGLLNAFAIVIAALLVFERPQLFGKSIMRTWGAWLIVCMVGVAAAPERGDAIRLMLQFLSNFAIYIGAYYFVRSDEDFKSCIKLVLWSSVLPAAYGVVQYALGDGFYTSDAGQRVNSTFSHPNVFAFFLTLILSLMFYVLKSGTFKVTTFKRVVFVLYMVLLAVLLVLTKTRSAWIAAFAFFLGYGLFYERRYLAYLLIGSVCALFIPEIGDRILDLTQGGSEVISSKSTLNSFAWRVSLWTSALDSMALSHYLQGYGLEAFVHNSPIFFAESGGVNWGAHNVYMEIFYDLGLLGIASFLWMYGRLLGTLTRLFAFNKLVAFTLMFVIVEYLVVCASDNMLYYLSFNWYLWFLYGGGAALAELHRDREPRDGAARKASGLPFMTSPSTRRALTSVAACVLVGSTISPSMAADATPWGSVAKPFTATSPWNIRPVAPVLGDFEIPKSDYFPNVGENAWSVPVFTTDGKDPPVTIYGVSEPDGVFDPDEERTRSITIPHWPPGVTPASGSDGHAEVIDTSTNVVHSFWELRRTGNRWTAALYAWSRLDGRGWGDPAHYYQGARAAGVPSIGGLIRKHEVDDGDTMYRHALAASLTFNGLSANPTYVYPATSADAGAAEQNSGKIPEGALLMLPAGFDVQQIGTPALRKVAETLKVYGTYIVDRNVGTPYFIYAEIGSGLFLMKRGWNNNVAADLDRIRAALRQVVSTGGWLDGDGKPYAPGKIFNVLSMRGPWQVESGEAPGNYETWKQAVVFPKAAPTRTVMVAYNGRALTQTTWALPATGASYQLSASTTGGAKLRIVLKTKVEGRLLYDSGELGDGQSKTFAWPADSTIVTYAISGVGQPSTVRGTLIAVDRKVASTSGSVHGG